MSEINFNYTAGDSIRILIELPENYEIEGIEEIEFAMGSIRKKLSTGGIVTTDLENVFSVSLKSEETHAIRQGMKQIHITVLDAEFGVKTRASLLAQATSATSFNTDAESEAVDWTIILEIDEDGATATASAMAVQRGYSAFELFKQENPDYTGTESEWVNSQIRSLIVADYETMLENCMASKPILFTVESDTDGSENMPYRWDGVTLFYLGIQAAEVQPEN